MGSLYNHRSVELMEAHHTVRGAVTLTITDNGYLALKV